MTELIKLSQRERERARAGWKAFNVTHHRVTAIKRKNRMNENRRREIQSGRVAT